MDKLKKQLYCYILTSIYGSIFLACMACEGFIQEPRYHSRKQRSLVEKAGYFSNFSKEQPWLQYPEDPFYLIDAQIKNYKHIDAFPAARLTKDQVVQTGDFDGQLHLSKGESWLQHPKHPFRGTNFQNKKYKPIDSSSNTTTTENQVAQTEDLDDQWMCHISDDSNREPLGRKRRSLESLKGSMSEKKAKYEELDKEEYIDDNLSEWRFEQEEIEEGEYLDDDLSEWSFEQGEIEGEYIDDNLSEWSFEEDKVATYSNDAKQSLIRCQVNSKDQEIVPLHLNARNRHVEIEKYGNISSDIDAENKDGETRLHRAVRNGDLETVKQLVKHGVGLDEKNKDGETPLHLAVRRKDLQMVKCLVKHGVDFDVKNKDDETPLHLAARSGYTNIVEYLLGHRVDIDVKNKDGETPLDLARANGHEAVDNVLSDYLSKEGYRSQQQPQNITMFTWIQEREE